MGRTKRTLCWLIMRLDWIPRYGRLYELLPERDDDGNRVIGPAEWTWQRYGHWGLNLLDRLGWLWQYIDEDERRDNGTAHKNN